MKHGSNPRRGRNRGNSKRGTSSRNQTFESNGPDGKIRGTAQQVLDRYLVLGRDAFSAGDPITAESFYQHAEHYFRLVSAADGNGAGRGPERGRVASATGESTAKDVSVETGIVETAASEAKSDEAESLA
jgi:hypothetical protein